MICLDFDTCILNNAVDADRCCIDTDDDDDNPKLLMLR